MSSRKEDVVFVVVSCSVSASVSNKKKEYDRALTAGMKDQKIDGTVLPCLLASAAPCGDSVDRFHEAPRRTTTSVSEYSDDAPSIRNRFVFSTR